MKKFILRLFLLSFVFVTLMTSIGFSEESSSSVGIGKGIVSADPKNGFQLSPEAIRNFGIQTLKISTKGPWLISKSAKVLSLNESHLYRLRDNFYKSIDFSSSLGSGPNILVSSDEIRIGDEIVVRGAEFLKVVELAAFDSESLEHSH